MKNNQKATKASTSTSKCYENTLEKKSSAFYISEKTATYGEKKPT